RNVSARGRVVVSCRKGLDYRQRRRAVRGARWCAVLEVGGRGVRVACRWRLPLSPCLSSPRLSVSPPPLRLPSQRPERGDKCVLELWLLRANVFDLDPGFVEFLAPLFLRFHGSMREQVQPVSKPLDINDLFVGTADFGQKALGLAKIFSSQFEPL